MTKAILKEVVIGAPRERVWGAIATRETLAQWVFPNDFEALVGHRFCFKVPGNPKVGFEGLTVRCEVLECEPPGRLVFTWSAGGAVENTRVSFRLVEEGEGTRVYFEHAGFDLSAAFGEQAFRGAEYGWAKMLGQLQKVISDKSPSDLAEGNS